MTKEERHATALWMSERGLDGLKVELLQKALSHFIGIFREVPPHVINLIGEVANTTLLECFNYVRQEENNKPNR